MSLGRYRVGIEDPLHAVVAFAYLGPPFTAHVCFLRIGGRGWGEEETVARAKKVLVVGRRPQVSPLVFRHHRWSAAVGAGPCIGPLLAVILRRNIDNNVQPSFLFDERASGGHHPRQPPSPLAGRDAS